MQHPACRRTSVLVVTAIAGLSIGTDAQAWGDEGHEIVAVIAYARLTPEARQRVDALLAADKDKLTAADFVSRATWADRYRDSDRFSTRTHYLATRQWHFVDIEIDAPDLDAACGQHPPLAAGTPASRGPPSACLVDKIDQFAAEWRAPGTTRHERQLALKFLLHFVGDLHQPLHAADHHDRGGNAVDVLYNKRTTPDNLHAYWDTHLVQKLGTDPRVVGAALNKKITKAKAAAWSKGAPGTWAQETFEKARDVAYDFSGEADDTDEHGGTAKRLDAVYDTRALPVVREQLSKAGVRLAAVLNSGPK